MNEFELQSIEAAESDSEWIKRIKAFWDEHAPVMLSEKSGYAYFAIDRSGKIVLGREPEYEEVAVSTSFQAFLDELADKKHTQIPSDVV